MILRMLTSLISLSNLSASPKLPPRLLGTVSSLLQRPLLKHFACVWLQPDWNLITGCDGCLLSVLDELVRLGDPLLEILGCAAAHEPQQAIPQAPMLAKPELFLSLAELCSSVRAPLHESCLRDEVNSLLFSLPPIQHGSLLVQPTFEAGLIVWSELSLLLCLLPFFAGLGV
jgi:hypothetical protein